VEGKLKELASNANHAQDRIDLCHLAPGKRGLFAKAALYVMGKGRDVLLLPKTAVNVVTQGSAMNGKALQSSLELFGRTLKGTISPEP
jgi:hypothetical protein